MKQKRLIGLALASVLVLSGCSASTMKDNGKDVVASIDGKNILADDLYKTLTSSQSGKQTLFSYVLDELIKTNFPVTKDMEENASTIVTNIKANYQNQYGEEADQKLSESLAASNYKDMDAYKQSLVYSLQYSEFIKKYVKANFDEIFEDYFTQETPRYVSLIKVAMADPENPTDDEKAKLEEVKTLLASDKKFADIASEYSDDEATKSSKGNLGIVDSTLQLTSIYGEEVEKAALSLESEKTSEAIKSEDGYYFLYCSSDDKETIKKELKTVDVDSPLLVYDQYLPYIIFKTYDIKYSDKDIEKEITTIIDEAIKARDDARGGND